MSDLLTGLGEAIQLVTTPYGFAAVVIGLVFGFIVGVLPGFSGPTATAILLPFAVLLGPSNSAILMIAIYCGTCFGGSIPAILLNIPGESGSAVVALDGYPMAHSGRPHLAIGIARMASVVGGVVGAVVTIILIQPLATIAVRIGPAELFVVALIAVVTCGSLVGRSVVKGIMVGLLGMLISLTGAGPVTAEARLDFGLLELYSGIPLVPAVIGMFAFCELIIVSRELKGPRRKTPAGAVGSTVPGRRPARVRELLGLTNFAELVEGMRVTLRHKMTLLRSSVLGVFVGSIPGLGASVAGFLAYGHAKLRSRRPEKFGKGNPVGILAPEACDNAVSGGILIPTLTLGIPGNATSAVLLAALYLNGVQVGPQLMTQHADIAYGLLMAALLASLLTLPIGILLAGPLIQLTRIRLDLLIPMVLVLAVLGAYSANNSIVSIGVAVVFGILAVVLRLCEYPIIPLFLGFILGPLTESSFVRALTLSQGEISIFWESVPSKVLLVVLLAIVLGSIRRVRRQRGLRESSTNDVGS